jgi:guanyl-specific ribonuclease Sa
MKSSILRFILALTIALAALPGCGREPQGQTDRIALPPEALVTMNLIERGGPFPYRKDGSEFHNRERLLPKMPRGHYREYTVDTPGSRDRGARRLVTGGSPPTVFYYTDDHYRSFRRIRPK